MAAVPIIMMSNNGPHKVLVQQKPTRHLLSFLPLFSVISFLLFQTLCYVAVWFYVQTQDWFEPYVFEAGVWPPNSSYEQTYIFLLSNAAAVIAAIVFSKGAPYRKPLYTNSNSFIFNLHCKSKLNRGSFEFRNNGRMGACSRGYDSVHVLVRHWGL